MMKARTVPRWICVMLYAVVTEWPFRRLRVVWASYSVRGTMRAVCAFKAEMNDAGSWSGKGHP